MRKSIILCLSAVALAFTACNSNKDRQDASGEMPIDSPATEVTAADVDTTTKPQSIIPEQNADTTANTANANQHEADAMPIDPSFLINDKNVPGNLKKYGFTKTGTRYEEDPFADQEGEMMKITIYTRNINGKKVTCEINEVNHYNMIFSDSKEKEEFLKAVKALGCGKAGGSHMFDANKWYIVEGNSVFLGSGGA